MQKLHKLKDANDAAIKVCKGCIDFGKITKESYEAALALVTEYLAGLSPEMLRRVTSLQEGILLKSKFMPTIADYHALVQELEAKDNQFRPAHTSYRRFSSDPLEPKSEESKARIAQAVRDFKNHIIDDPVHGKLPPVQYLDGQGNTFKSTLDMDRLIASHDTAIANRKQRAA